MAKAYQKIFIFQIVIAKLISQNLFLNGDFEAYALSPNSVKKIKTDGIWYVEGNPNARI